MNKFSALMACALLAGCAGCTDAVFENETAANTAGRTDGLEAKYFLPKAMWRFVADYDASKVALSLATDGNAPEIVADETRPYYLSYAHAGLSDDTVDVAWNDGRTLKSISSESSDQTNAALKAADDTLTQLAATEKSLATAATSASSAAKIAQYSGQQTPPAPPPPCAVNLESTVEVDLSAGTQRPLRINEGGTCTLYIHVDVQETGKPADFRASQTLDNPPPDPCADAVCFPLAEEVAVTATATLMKDGQAAPIGVLKKYFDLSVPSATALGYIQFDRRAFVDNKTSITFANGVVNEFKSTDPSIVAGAFQLATNSLTTVALAVALTK